MGDCEFSSEKIEKHKFANRALLINDDSDKERDRNIIFVYCPPKVGSTSLVSSIRLFANEKFNVLHLHNEQILKFLYDIDVSINDIIKYNSYLGKNIFVFDIYRNPIEKKISIFFEKLESLHFNSNSEMIETYPIEKLISRFNSIFPYLGENDYFRNEYTIACPEKFDFDKKFLLVEKQKIKYIKLRLSDSSHYWSSILNTLLGIELKIIRDYETKEKRSKDIFQKFIENYKIPENLFELIKQDEQTTYYMNESDRTSYFNEWRKKTTSSFNYYTNKQYDFYLKISSENQNRSEVHADHYIDNGCICNSCFEKRFRLRDSVRNGETKPNKIRHEVSIPSRRPVLMKVETRNKKKNFRNFKFFS